MENRFNLIDEPWIPVADVGQVSLKDIFSNPSLRALGGNPVQKIAITKLLLAIAQSAATPQNDDDWKAMGWQGMADKCINYLSKWHDRFYLYGDQPFLQMPQIKDAKVRSFGVLSPEIITGNSTLLLESQLEQTLSDADIAVLLICQMGFSLGGKKSDNAVILTSGYLGKFNPKGNSAVGVPGVFIGKISLGKGKQAGGLLHSMWLGSSIIESIWINLLTAEDISDIANVSYLGKAPWEAMPQGEDCDIAQLEKYSYMSHLVPVNKFCLITQEGFHLTDGIVYPSYEDGRINPSTSVNISGEKPIALWVNPQKRPWRELASILQFVDMDNQSSYQSILIERAIRRLRITESRFALWSGGLRVTTHTTGEQYASGSDDYVQSELWLDVKDIGTIFFAIFKQEIAILEKVRTQLIKVIEKYFHLAGEPKPSDSRKQTKAKEIASSGERLFWQLCERQSQALIDACDSTEEAKSQRQQLRKIFIAYANQVFDQVCPNSSARQMDAWAQARPNFSKYLKDE